MTSPFFEFEQDFVGSLRCIPMVVRQKLDVCGVKLKLEHWNQFSMSERSTLVERACGTPAEADSYRVALQDLIETKNGAPAKTLEIDPAPAWQDPARIPEAVAAKFQQQTLSLLPDQWAALSDLQRFALIKLSRSSHENSNFLPAVREFGLVVVDEVTLD